MQLLHSVTALIQEVCSSHARLLIWMKVCPSNSMDNGGLRGAGPHGSSTQAEACAATRRMSMRFMSRSWVAMLPQAS